MQLNPSNVNQLAATFTELAIQNGLIPKCRTATENAKEVTKFFNTIVETINKSTEE